jgi:hypothetical protein
MTRDDSLSEGEMKLEVDSETMASMAELTKAITEIQRRNRGDAIVSMTEICVNVSAAHFTDLEFVDLPGLINFSDRSSSVSDDDVKKGDGPTDDVAVVQEMVLKYIEPKRSLIVLVRNVNQDDEAQNAYGLLKRVDKGRERTIQVLTKCDAIETDETTDRAIRWLRDSEDNALGYHACCCRIRGKDTDYETENALLKDAFTDCENVGVQRLQGRLSQLLKERIKVNLPIIMKEISKEIENAHGILERVGQVAKKPDDILEALRAHLLQIEEDITDPKFTTLLKDLQDSLAEVEEKIDAEFTTGGFHISVFRPAMFEGEKAFSRSIRKISNIWQPIVEAFIVRCVELIQVLDGEALKPISKDLRQEITNNWATIAAKIAERFRDKCMTEFQKERGYATMSDALAIDFVSEAVCPSGFVDEFLHDIEAKLRVEECVNTASKRWIEETLKARLRSAMIDAAKAYAKDQKQKDDPIARQKVTVHNAVRAYFPHMIKKLMDNLLYAVRSELMQPRGEWIDRDITGNTKFIKSASEEERIKRQREKALKTISLMRQCQDDLALLK